MPAPKQAGITSCLMLWTVPGSLEQKLEIAARAGMQSIGLCAEHENWSDTDIRRMRILARSFRLPIATIGANPSWNKPGAGTSSAGKGAPSLTDPASHTGIFAELEKSIAVARELEIPYLVLASGPSRTGTPRGEQWSAMVEICRRCADTAEKAKMTALIQPVHSRSKAEGPFLTTCKDGLQLVREVAHPRLRLLFNIFHEQMETGNIIDTIKRAAPVTAMFQVADVPGRNEPGTGELYYPNIYRAIREAGFEGHLAMDFLPTGEPVVTLIRAIDEMRAGLRTEKS